MKMNNLADLALLDTNILVYADQEESPYHQAAKTLRDRGHRGEIPVCVAPQVLSEFFAIVTKTGRGRARHPMSPAEAADEVRKYYHSENILKIYPTPDVIPRMLSLLERHPVSGQNIHDLHLIATMLENGVTKIYTLNARHFVPFTEIEVLTPPEPTLTP